jgi:hypothetical protein
MTPNGLQVLESLQTFLQSDVLPLVPKRKRSDMRAAIKSLANARQELDELYPLLVRECAECELLCREAAQAMPGSGTSGTPAPDDACRVAESVGEREDAPGNWPSTLSELITRHAGLLSRLGDLVLRLQRDGAPEAKRTLARIYRTMGEHSRKRLRWQSVFPPQRLVSEQLAHSWVNGASQ